MSWIKPINEYSDLEKERKRQRKIEGFQNKKREERIANDKAIVRIREQLDYSNRPQK